MFPKISSSLGTSLGWNDPKLAFRTQPGGIAKLAEHRRIAETDDVYWSQFVLLFDSASDVFTLITPHDVRRALNEAPENVATLIRVISNRLFTLLIDHTFPSVQASSLAKLSSSWSTGASERNTTKEALNCLRVLSRVLPVVFESDDPTFEQDLFWTRPTPSTPDPTREDVISDQPQFVIEEAEEEEFGYKPPEELQANKSDASKKTEELPTLAERLFATTIDLLFCCGFTLPTSIQVEHHKINYVIWDKGIGSATAVGSTPALDSNKTEVLRFLLILLSKTIYHSPSQLLSLPNSYAAQLVHKTPRRLVLALLCSLLNTAMNGESGASGDGWNLSGMVQNVPYNHLILSAARKGEADGGGRTGLVGTCLGILLALLDYQADAARDPGALDAMSGADASPTASSNAFRYFVAKLHRPSDFEFILDGILSTLKSDLANTHNVLPGSRKSLPYVLETFVLLWKMLELNKKFRAFLLESDKLLDTVGYLLCFCLDNKDKPQHHGLCRALSYIIQSLSAERRFGAQMQDTIPLRVAIPTKWAVPGTAGDFLVSSIYSIVATTSGSLNSLYPALIIAISNVAPYLKNLTVRTSTRLIQLFSAFSSPVFLLADDGHPRLVFFMLEAINAILFHQLSNNPNVVYAILRSHRDFEELGTFTLAKGLREVRRIQQMKDERAKQAALKKSGKRSTTSTIPEENATGGDADAPEKASLLFSHRDSAEAEEERPIATSASSTTEDGQEMTTPVAAVGGVTPLGSPPLSASTVGNFSELRSQTTSPDEARRIMSEKARGKMRERSMSIEQLDPELESIAAAGVGRNGFVPTQEWVTSWQQGLPLDPVLLAIAELLPKVTDLQASLNRPTTSSAVIELLRSADLSHVLPPTPSLNPRRFQWSDASLVWLSSLIWGELYVRGSTVLGIWNGTNVRLFGVRHTPQPRGVGEAVQNVVGGFLGSGGGGANNGSGSPITSGGGAQSPSGRSTPARSISNR